MPRDPPTHKGDCGRQTGRRIVKSSRAFVLAAITLGMFISGCAIRGADFTAISTKNVNLKGVDLNKLDGRRVEGRDSNFVFLFIPFGFPHLEDAVDDALAKGGGDLMLDAVFHARSWWFLVGQDIIEVKGTVVNTFNAKGRY